jgi:predicted ribosome quality control (RQC) complex YloA/Tae2 family protein
VGELCREVGALLTGGRVKDVAALPPRDVLLVIEPREGLEGAPPVLRLRLSAHPEAARVHLQQGRTYRHDGPISPFYEGLQQELLGAEVRSVSQVRGDRIVFVEFKGGPSGKARTLALELFGRRANLLLLDQNEQILDLLVPGHGKNAERLAPGSTWDAPGGAGAPSGPEPPSIAESFPQPDEVPPGPVPDRAPLSWRVERTLEPLAQEAHRMDAGKRLAARAKRKHDRAKGLVVGLEQRAAAAEGADRVREDGELLKSALGRLKRGMESIELEDWFTEGTPLRSIELDPKRTPQQNLQRTFDRFHKLERARESVASELERARAKVLALAELLEAAESAEDPTALDLAAVKQGLLDPLQQADARKRKAPAVRVPYRVFTVADGYEVRVGRAAKDNDKLTFHHARGNDYWLHTADCPGSHVILRVEKNREPSQQALLEAAFLAIHFSPAKEADKAPVHVAQRKFVHKPRGAKPGLVNLSGGRVMQVRMQHDRVAELLRATRGGPEGPRAQ